MSNLLLSVCVLSLSLSLYIYIYIHVCACGEVADSLRTIMPRTSKAPIKNSGFTSSGDCMRLSKSTCKSCVAYIKCCSQCTCKLNFFTKSRKLFAISFAHDESCEERSLCCWTLILHIKIIFSQNHT